MPDSVMFPIACPQCLATSGMPYRAGTSVDKSGIVVSLRCMGCGGEWDHEMPKSAEFDGVLSNTGVSLNPRENA